MEKVFGYIRLYCRENHLELIKIFRDLGVTKYLELESIGKLKSYLNQHSYATKRGKAFNDMGIKNILNNDFYIGKVSWGELETEGQHEAIIELDLFNQVQKQLKRNTRNPGPCR